MPTWLTRKWKTAKAWRWKLTDQPIAARVLHRVTVVLSVVSGAWVAYKVWKVRPPTEIWTAELAVFIAVIVVPYWFIDRIAEFAEGLMPAVADKKKVYERRFKNLGALVGLAERPILFGALISGFPQFIAVWYVLKGLAGFSTSPTDRDETIRTFQLYLLNSALSLAGVALGWLAWKALGFHTAQAVRGD